MKLVDANVLLYAYNEDADFHSASRSWLLDALWGREGVIIPWISLLAFLRVSTSPAAQRSPNTVAQSVAYIEEIVSAPNVIHGEPDREHLGRVAALLDPIGTGGNLVDDAHLAALALQYDATVISYDNDFGRFPGVRWRRPTDG